VATASSNAPSVATSLPSKVELVVIAPVIAPPDLGSLFPAADAELAAAVAELAPAVAELAAAVAEFAAAVAELALAVAELPELVFEVAALDALVAAAAVDPNRVSV